MTKGFVIRNTVTGEFAANDSGLWVARKDSAKEFRCEDSAETVANFISFFVLQECVAEVI